MSIEQEIKAIREYRKKVLSSKKLAYESLYKAGICNRKGELTKQYDNR